MISWYILAVLVSVFAMRCCLLTEHDQGVVRGAVWAGRAGQGAAGARAGGGGRPVPARRCL